jgi:hypothetical protein
MNGQTSLNHWAFFIMVKLKDRLIHDDLCSRCETPAGARGRGDPAGALAPRRLPGPPAESEAPGVQINRQPLAH